MDATSLTQLQQYDTDRFTTGISSTMMEQLTGQIETMLLWATIFSIVLIVPFLVLYIFNTRRKWKVQKAIFDIQATLHEMNDRQSSHQTHSPTGPVQATTPLSSQPTQRPTSELVE